MRFYFSNQLSGGCYCGTKCVVLCLVTHLLLDLEKNFKDRVVSRRFERNRHDSRMLKKHRRNGVIV